MWTGRPPHRISPLVGSQAPETHFTSTVLPAPLSPTSAVTCPAGTSRSTPSSAWTGPKLFQTPRSSSSGSRVSSPDALVLPPGLLPVGASTALTTRVPSRAPGGRFRIGRRAATGFCHVAARPHRPLQGYEVEMPACWHALANDPEHRSEVLTNWSLTTVEAMFSVVTHTGVRSTEGTWEFAVLSAVCPFTRPDG